MSTNFHSYNRLQLLFSFFILGLDVAISNRLLLSQKILLILNVCSALTSAVHHVRHISIPSSLLGSTSHYSVQSIPTSIPSKLHTSSPTKAPNPSSIDSKLIIIIGGIVGVILVCGLLHYIYRLYRTYYQKQRQLAPYAIYEGSQESCGARKRCNSYLGDETEWSSNPLNTSRTSDCSDRCSADYRIDVEAVTAFSEAARIKQSIVLNQS